MTEAPDPKRARFPLADQAEEAARELKYRYGVYAKRVAEGRMTQAQADRQIALMRAIRDTLLLFGRFEDCVRATVKECLEIEELKQNPAVQAVLAGFPDADVGAPRTQRAPAADLTSEQPPFDPDAAEAA